MIFRTCCSPLSTARLKQHLKTRYGWKIIISFEGLRWRDETKFRCYLKCPSKVRMTTRGIKSRFHVNFVQHCSSFLPQQKMSDKINVYAYLKLQQSTSDVHGNKLELKAKAFSIERPLIAFCISPLCCWLGTCGRSIFLPAAAPASEESPGHFTGWRCHIPQGQVPGWSLSCKNQQNQVVLLHCESFLWACVCFVSVALH